MAKFDFDKPVASFSWYLQNGSADDKRGNRLHVGTGQKAQIYFDPESGEFIGKLKYVDDYIDLADGAKQHFELPRTAREYKPSDFSPKFPISNVKFEVDESVKDFIHVLPRGLFFYQNEFYDAVFGDKTDYPESLKDFLFTRTGDIEAAGELYGAIEKKTKAELAKEFLEYKSWHHSSRTAREVEFFGLNEDAVCRSFEQMSEEQIIERDRQMADERAALEARLQFMQSREKEFEKKFECNPSSVLAYEAIHPEMCERFISRRKNTEMIKYRLPTEAVKAGMKEEQVCPVAHASQSRVAYFHVFMQGTGKKRHWENVDFEVLAEKFTAAKKTSLSSKSKRCVAMANTLDGFSKGLSSRSETMR